MSEIYNEISAKDISYILENPWALTDSEWNLQDKSMLQEAFADITQRLKSSVEDGYTKIWRTPSQEPIAILGGYKIADKKYETFFLASQHMDEYALKLSFDMRNILREKASIYKGCTLGLFSTSDHPSQKTWFRFLGFKHVPEGDLGMTRYFECTSPK